MAGRHEGWLLILDNVTSPGDIAPLLTRLRSGRVVVTSRLCEGWHRLGAHVLDLDVPTENGARFRVLSELAQMPFLRDPDSAGAVSWPVRVGWVSRRGR
jgi:hypothetical protein